MGAVMGFYDDCDEALGLIITKNVLNYMERLQKALVCCG
jgi:hypothetical protein